jgi:hypothetical protein
MDLVVIFVRVGTIVSMIAGSIVLLPIAKRIGELLQDSAIERRPLPEARSSSAKSVALETHATREEH